MTQLDAASGAAPGFASLVRDLNGHVPGVLLCVDATGKIHAAALPAELSASCDPLEGQALSELLCESSATSSLSRLSDCGRQKLQIQLPTNGALVQTEAEIILINDRREQLGSSIHAFAHEVRSPLSALRGYAALLETQLGAALDKLGRSYLDRLRSTVDRVQAQVEDLLEQSKILTCECERRLLSARPLLLQLASELKPELEARGIQLQLPEDPPPLYADQARLTQVVLNLVLNAIHHMGKVENPRIEIRIEELDEGVNLIVSDNGMGIPSSEHVRLRELFACAHSGRNLRSTGLGLSIVKRILTAHGGFIDVKSSPGAGATFCAFFPKP